MSLNNMSAWGKEQITFDLRDLCYGHTLKNNACNPFRFESTLWRLIATVAIAKKFFAGTEHCNAIHVDADGCQTSNRRCGSRIYSFLDYMFT